MHENGIRPNLFMMVCLQLLTLHNSNYEGLISCKNMVGLKAMLHGLGYGVKKNLCSIHLIPEFKDARKILDLI